MSMKSRSALAALTMMAMMSGMGSERRPKEKVLSFNERKKCFRKGCNNHRNGKDSLYCSNECQEIYHEELKKLETK